MTEDQERLLNIAALCLPTANKLMDKMTVGDFRTEFNRRDGYSDEREHTIMRARVAIRLAKSLITEVMNDQR